MLCVNIGQTENVSAARCGSEVLDTRVMGAKMKTKMFRVLHRRRTQAEPPLREDDARKCEEFQRKICTTWQICMEITTRPHFLPYLLFINPSSRHQEKDVFLAPNVFAESLCESRDVADEKEVAANSKKQAVSVCAGPLF
ncbi:hypothetical protein F2P81_011978 [Scophthalmus maximus]|uniref:Uncharacterized protein n=1 Tax=Scophthalmus maximus TaxID=52904 RepID=A0A6A4SNC0_SCOMX|nr:hypothetical protein F2P81_011978 [Scophthalmus maximus]